MNLFSSLKHKVVPPFLFNDLRIIKQALMFPRIYSSQKKLFSLYQKNLPSSNELFIALVKRELHSKINRIPLWKFLAEIEKKRNNHLLSAVYQLRILRSLGIDRFNQLSYITQELKEHHFEQEAIAVNLMYGHDPDKEKRCFAYLQERLRSHKQQQEYPYEFIDDRRTKPSYKVSVIVSLYKAASKLSHFLHLLSEQTFTKANQAEIILIDSGSTTEEHAVFKQFMKETNNSMSIVYARCFERETIQKAWNRGISLSKATYLSFLGVDETLLPEALHILSSELDHHPSIDWVQSNSFICNVNAHGQEITKTSLYDRTGYKQSLVYLETCYLSWVGALYRRSIHEKWGFYDPTFKAAGDTEFKNRILPFIQTKYISKTLGKFLNYPETRITESPIAEIEDLRAWYLHRTFAGIRYAFENKPIFDVEEAFALSLSYRKSYLGHLSTDVEYAYNLISYLLWIKISSPIAKHRKSIEQLLIAYRSLDYIESNSLSENFHRLFGVKHVAAKIQKNLQKDYPHASCKIFNDNRYEQHTQFWF